MEDRGEGIFRNYNLRLSLLPHTLRHLSIFVGSALGPSFHGSVCIWRDVFGIAIECLSSKRTAKDTNRVEDKTRPNFHQRR